MFRENLKLEFVAIICYPYDLQLSIIFKTEVVYQCHVNYKKSGNIHPVIF